MEVIVLDSSFTPLALIDTASVLWACTYNSVGTFELHYKDINYTDLSFLQINNFIYREGRDELGVIEYISISDKQEGTQEVIVKGRFADCILERRIVLEQTTLEGKIEDVIQNLINNNITYPSDLSRAIPFFSMPVKSGINIKVDKQETGTDLLSIITDLCQTNDVGFKTVFDPVKKTLEFKLYQGIDRSVATDDTQQVIFSTDYENVYQLTYITDISKYKNVTLVAGEGEGTDRKTVLVDNDNKTGMSRYEVFTDARDLSSNDGQITADKYTSELKERGIKNLNTFSVTKSFQGDVNMLAYKYKIDYDVGDLVRVENQKWGLVFNPRIVEVLESEDQNGYSVSPTFGE